VPIDKTKHARVTLSIRDRDRLEHHTAASHIDDRERVRVAMRINTNHVVELLCTHPTHLQPRLGDNSGAGPGVKTAGGRTVISHARNGRTGF
jgi:hypothetical protein